MNLLDYYRNEKDSVKISHNKELDLYTVSYLHGGVNFESQEIRQARGLTLDREGNIVTRGFEKFFNYKQLEAREELSEEFKQEFNEIQNKDGKLLVEEKLDGTLILLSVYNGDFIVSTTSTTTTDYSVYAKQYFNSLEDNIKEKLKDELDNYTLAFEYVSPTNQVVVRYEEERFVLLGKINNQTGEEASYKELLEIGKEFGFKVYDVYLKTFEELLEDQKSDKNLEGYVVRNNYGRRIKIKLDSWFEQSKTVGIFNGRNLTKAKITAVIEAYLEDTVDDLIAYENQHKYLRSEGNLSKVLKQIEDYVSRSEEVYQEYLDGKIERKEIARKGSPVSTMVFSKISNGEYIDKYKIDHLRNQIRKDLKVDN